MKDGGDPFWQWVRSLLLGSALLWTSCAAADHGERLVQPGRLVPSTGGLLAPASHASEHTVVLVAIDGVRWEDVFFGVERALARAKGLEASELLGARELTPNLRALMDRGATLGGPGQPFGISASGPDYVSVPGYLEMMTGRHPTGCDSNECPATREPTLADDFAAELGTGPLDVAIIASWEKVDRAAAKHPSRVTISTGRTHGLTRDRLRYDAIGDALLAAGERAGPKPGSGDYRRDRETANIALRYLERLRPRFLFLGLGDTDEYAHDDDYRGYLRALQSADQVVGEVAARLAEYEREGRRTTLLVTTDHGRSADFRGHGRGAPESAKVFLIAAGHGIAARGPSAPPRERYLADVASTIRALAGVGRTHESSEPLAELMVPARTELASGR